MKIPQSKIKVLVVFAVSAIALLILIFLYIITFEQINTSLSTSKKLMHARNIELELERLISHLKQAETAQRGFIITQDSSFLKPFQRSNLRISSSFSTLKEMLSQDEIQLHKLESLEKKVSGRYILLKKNMEGIIYKEVLPDSIIQKFEFGNNLMESTINSMNEMIEYQDNTLIILRKQHHDSLVSTPIIYFSIVLITLSVFTFFFLKLNADRKKLKDINDELTIINHSFAQAEKLAGLGNWRYNFQDSKSQFSENFYSLLGLHPTENNFKLKHFLGMVLPDDRPVVLNAFKDVFRKYKAYDINYRISTNEGNIRNMKSIAKIISDYDNARYIIGINMDVTDQVANSRLLEIKNKKLEIFNADLASFNYVASHDLQAPLRKIQMFISRINEMETNISEQGIENFKRIHDSASHMQVLINDLLMFSRTNAANKKFELTDLNKILSSAKEELAFLIDEKKAIIESTSLPSISAIPYQLEQLFINLLSNSIKFAKDGISPHIFVNCKIVEKQIENVEGNKITDVYHNISFTDNGIGFDIDYAQKIFQLLFRLHDKSQYPGSGIGLAICKKIVDNHFGMIEAKGEVGKGATFNVFIPVIQNQESL